ncbi:UDP-N-acetylglucosamine 2-epimerase [Smithella sp. SC_K08D17]|jgi:UDP-N-acetylglucosamine 2-epimerase|nr:UDP-N-acetylglucosamine 2-epimerase [Smithella sp. D17]KIE18408.1 UDP-N-acetylglucosamine 2-epimerase [Smithella sp. SC_K08D17]
MKIVTIIGARPQFIKAAAVSRAIDEHNRLTPDTAPFTNDASPMASNPLPITEVLVHTGQHYDEDMSAIFFRELEIPEPAYNLGIGSGTHGQQTGEMLAAIEKVLIVEKPDWVIVYGDTNSTLAGALAAAKLHIPIAHVEAGLRSFNRLMPEEINRIVADHLSHLLLCPSQIAVNNLTNEGISKGVTIVGDVMADALQFAVNKVQHNIDIKEKFHLQHGTYLLTTIHRAENTDNKERLQSIINALNSLEETIVLPIHPRTRKILNGMNCRMKPHIRIIDPVGYFGMIALENSARMILTDSGGIQKEAYWLKVPCITLRNETEWVETVENGWNKLTGANPTAIIDAVHNFKPPTEQAALYGNGQAASRVLQEITNYIERK